jgi:hypothetical protein
MLHPAPQNTSRERIHKGEEIGNARPYTQSSLPPNDEGVLIYQHIPLLYYATRLFVFTEHLPEQSVQVQFLPNPHFEVLDLYSPSTWVEYSPFQDR